MYERWYLNLVICEILKLRENVCEVIKLEGNASDDVITDALTAARSEGPSSSWSESDHRNQNSLDSNAFTYCLTVGITRLLPRLECFLGCSLEWDHFNQLIRERDHLGTPSEIKTGLSGKNSQVGRPPLPQYGNAHVTKTFLSDPGRPGPIYVSGSE